MGEIVLENLTKRNLIIFVICLFLCQTICFLLAVFLAPSVTDSEVSLGFHCTDSNGTIRPNPECHIFRSENHVKENHTAKEKIFVFKIPLRQDGIPVPMSRWHQRMIGVISIELQNFNVSEVLSVNHVLNIGATFSHRNLDDPAEKWTILASAEEERSLLCPLTARDDGFLDNCKFIPLFEIENLYYDNYLVNVRIPTVNNTLEQKGRIADIMLLTERQNANFTKTWLSMKTVFFPLTICVLFWYCYRLNRLPRMTSLLEKILILVGVTVILLNLPIEYFTLCFSVPFIKLINDIRLLIFYCVMMNFWLILAGEQLLSQVQRKSTNLYFKYICTVVCVLFCVFSMNIYGEVLLLQNPLTGLWISDAGINLTLAITILSGIFACIYFLFLSFMFYKIFQKNKFHQVPTSCLRVARTRHYHGITSRFKFLLLFTLICVFASLVYLMIEQISHLKWMWNTNLNLDYISPFLFGIFGMWNLYVCTFLLLYAPSYSACLGSWKVDSDIYYS